MNAELQLLGVRLNFSSRSRRRGLVVLVYVVLGTFFYLSWRVDRCAGTGIYLVFFIQLVNQYFFGGVVAGGLIRPFSKHTRPVFLQEGPPPQSRIDRWFWRRAPRMKDLQSDERDEIRRDRAHYLAYKVMSGFVAILFLLLYFIKERPFLGSIAVPFDWALGTALLAVLLAQTLPQAILLWTEPDMEEERQ
jgi:hypothetical protein